MSERSLLLARQVFALHICLLPISVFGATWTALVDWWPVTAALSFCAGLSVGIAMMIWPATRGTAHE